MVERILVELPVSPWSERARWALDHHKLAYKKVLHEVFIGEGKLKRLRKKHGDNSGGKATVPLLLEDKKLYGSSTEIARHADLTGSGSALFLPGREKEMAVWAQNADDGMNAGRAPIARRLLDSPLALDEQLPPYVPGVVRPLMRPVTRYATGWFAHKYGVDVDDKDAIAAKEADACRHIDRVREGLQRSSPYLLGTFSWADIVSCLLLQAVLPVQHPKYPLLPATRAQWTAPHLVERYRDLLAWRDELYAKHR